MSTSRPEFHLRRVLADGTAGEPEIYPLHAPPEDMALSRRGFLGTGVAAASVLTLMSGCQKSSEPQRKPGEQGYAGDGAIMALLVSPDGQVAASAADATWRRRAPTPRGSGPCPSARPCGRWRGTSGW